MLRNQEFYDRIQVTEFLLQVMTLVWASEDVTNTKLYQELQHQNQHYLERIIEQNNQIIKYLSEL